MGTTIQKPVRKFRMREPVVEMFIRNDQRKRFALMVLFLSYALLPAAPALCQNSSTHSNLISIGVAQGLSLYVNKGLTFGTIVQQAGNVSVQLTSLSAGEVTIYGQKNRSVYVTLSPPSALVNGSNTITYTPQAAYNSSADNPSSATVWSNPSGLQSAIQLQANSHGQGAEAYIYVYGSLNVGNVTPGAYTGNFGISVTY